MEYAMSQRHAKFSNEPEPTCYSYVTGANADMSLSMFKVFSSDSEASDDYQPTEYIMVR